MVKESSNPLRYALLECAFLSFTILKHIYRTDVQAPVQQRVSLITRGQFSMCMCVYMHVHACVYVRVRARARARRRARVRACVRMCACASAQCAYA